ncbi:MAG: cytochrome C oxidase subunit IV family protein [Paludisphaera borealis]|uniref:cytochrome C oxidase subunit IV family protein n=1 Tax=Paludisphaera borealis TaxID=1387353 RepID=UPI00283EF590|nr:cytochrome C oxidase subunit IV family protein [Paludisphaera borealis]MDR3622679.1 cytochrome C oxidase subunit IV family protein [Paludisphaera borealis]
MTHHIISIRTYVIIYAVLMLLLVATAGAAFLPLGNAHLPVAMTIAVIKAVLIVLFFMHVYYSSRLTWVVSVASFLWLGLLLVFLIADYFSRGWLDIPGK